MKNQTRPAVGDKVAIYHQSHLDKKGNAELEPRQGKPEISQVVAVYAQKNRVRVTSGEFWDVIPCNNSTAKWMTASAV